MAIVDLVMPKLGESIMEATILKWHKQPGDSIKMDETLLEIATDKVDSEVPSTAEGTIEEILFKENDVVPIGMVIARINDGGAEHARPQHAQPEPQRELNTPSQIQEEQEVTSYTEVNSVMQDQPASTGNGNGRFYSPLVLNIAASEGVSMTELEKSPEQEMKAGLRKKTFCNS